MEDEDHQPLGQGILPVQRLKPAEKIRFQEKIKGRELSAPSLLLMNPIPAAIRRQADPEEGVKSAADDEGGA